MQLRVEIESGARISLHCLTMRNSTLCNCCPGCVRSCLLTFLKKGGPFALNSLMIINTKLGWNEGGEDGIPKHVYGYSLGFGQLELICFFINVIFMIVSILFALVCHRNTCSRAAPWPRSRWAQ